jgi:hypothetical protein
MRRVVSKVSIAGLMLQRADRQRLWRQEASVARPLPPPPPPSSGAAIASARTAEPVAEPTIVPQEPVREERISSASLTT